MRMFVFIAGLVLAGCMAPSRDAHIQAEVNATMQDALRVETEKFAELLSATLSISRVDNSTSDRVVNRVLVIGVVSSLVMLVASYPVGKMIWMIGRRMRGPGGALHT